MIPHPIDPSSLTEAEATIPVEIMDAAYLIEKAAHENADGVLALRRGDCGRAYHSLVRTLVTLADARQELMMEQEHVDNSPVNDPPLHCYPASHPALPPTSAATTTNTTTSAPGRRRPTKNCRAVSVPYLEDSGFYIYSSGLVFSRRPRIGGDYDQANNNDDANSTSTTNTRRIQQQLELACQLDTIIYCEAMAQFNLGLAYHQRGRHCGEDRTLLGALELYSQSMATLRALSPKAEASTSHTNDLRVLQLAVMNNKIHILNEMARYPEALSLVNAFMLQSVQALSVVDVDEQQGRSSSVCVLTRPEIDNFLLNALVIRRFTTAPSA